jgi:tetratricopeptide (TPR) repeat protein
MSENLENANELIEKIKSNKKFKMASIAVGAVVVLVLGYVAYYNFIYLPAEEKSRTAYWRELIMVENDSLDVALDGFESIAKQYDGKSGGEVSNYMAGRILMQKGQFEDALKYLEKADLDDVYLGSMVIGLQGDCHVELKNFDQAVKLYEKAAGRQENEMTSPMFLKKAALVYELELKNFDKATELYKRIEMEYYDYAKTNNIEKYIARASNKQ